MEHKSSNQQYPLVWSVFLEMGSQRLALEAEATAAKILEDAVMEETDPLALSTVAATSFAIQGTTGSPSQVNYPIASYERQEVAQMMNRQRLAASQTSHQDASGQRRLAEAQCVEAWHLAVIRIQATARGPL